MFKNVSSQTVTLLAVDASTGLQKTGDSANMVFYVSKDDGTVTAISASSGVPTEVDSTNGKGLYKIALSQAETNADKLLFSGKSSTANVVVVPAVLYTLPANFTTLGITAGGKISEVVLSDTITTYTGDTPQTGDSYARWTTAMTESYGALNATVTPIQALYMIMNFLFNHSVSGTTWTVKKVDGSTSAMTFTLDSSVTPTSIVRAS